MSLPSPLSWWHRSESLLTAAEMRGLTSLGGENMSTVVNALGGGRTRVPELPEGQSQTQMFTTLNFPTCILLHLAPGNDCSQITLELTTPTPPYHETTTLSKGTYQHRQYQTSGHNRREARAIASGGLKRKQDVHVSAGKVTSQKSTKREHTVVGTEIR